MSALAVPAPVRGSMLPPQEQFTIMGRGVIDVKGKGKMQVGAREGLAPGRYRGQLFSSPLWPGCS